MDDRPFTARAFLGIGPDAPRPSGPEDEGLRSATLRQVQGFTFRLRVNVWSLLWRWRRFPWGEFQRRLMEQSEFRGYANWQEMSQSLGWSGLTEQGDKWLFGVAGYRIPLYGSSAMRHELFHAAQDI